MLTKRNKVLIIDDQPNIIRTLKHCFLAKGYDVNVALSGEDALGFLSKIKVDLVLLDVKIPGGCAEISKFIREKHPETKVILISRPNRTAVKTTTIAQTPNSPEMEKNILLVKTILLLTARDLCKQHYQFN